MPAVLRLLGLLRGLRRLPQRLTTGPVHERQARILAEFLHIAQHLRRGGIALVGIGGHGVHRDLLEAARDTGDERAGQRRAAVDVLDGDGDGVSPS